MNSEEAKIYFQQLAKSMENKNDQIRGLSIFLGGSTELKKTIYEVGLAYLTMEEAKTKEREREYSIWSNKYEELRLTHFPEFNKEELPIYLVMHMEFIKRYLNRIYQYESDFLNNTEGFVNRIKNSWNGVDEIKPLVNPVAATYKPDMPLRDRMRRRHRAGAQHHPDTIGVILYNSFVYVRIRRPKKIALIQLINDIETTLRNFGEKIVINSINLERAGIARKIVDFFINHIIFHTVDDILDKEELKSVFLANDIDAICMALLESSSPNGVYYQMTCLANKCNHSELKIYDPHDLYVVVNSELAEDQKDFIYEITNTGKAQSIEKIRSYQNRYSFKGEPVNVTQKLYIQEVGVKTDALYGEINLAIPTMAEYFNSFDMMAETYNSTIQNYAIDFPDRDTFNKKRSEFLGAVRMGEYVHWIKNYVTYAEPNAEFAENIVDDRTESQREFEQGLLDIFSDDDFAYWSVLTKIMETVPFMTHSLVGFSNSQCSACKGLGGETKDEEGNEIPVSPLVKASGFTPIDPVLNFFDHTRMLIETLGQVQMVQEEITS